MEKARPSTDGSHCFISTAKPGWSDKHAVFWKMKDEVGVVEPMECLTQVQAPQDHKITTADYGQLDRIDVCFLTSSPMLLYSGEA